MPDDTLHLPNGYTHIFLDEIDSTNAEALRRSGHDAPSGLWIWAARQSAGRGRMGRQWISDEGNLFASLLLRPQCVLGQCPQLAFAAAIAVYDAVKDIGGEQLTTRLSLKWPNDLLLDGAKLGGILLESVSATDTAKKTIVIGTGLNLISHPSQRHPPVTSLALQKISSTPKQAFEHLAHHTAKWIDIWSQGAGWSKVRAAWQERSIPAGTAIAVKISDEPLSGSYAGITDEGALLLDTGQGAGHETGTRIRQIHAGDVFLL